MSNQDYKKSYTGLILWIAAIVLFCVSGSWWGKWVTGLIPEELMIRLLNLVLLAFVDLLIYLVYRGQYVYWVSGGPDYETAKAAGPERRKVFCWKLLKPFLIMSGVFLIYFVISLALHLPTTVDTGFLCVCILLAALATRKVEL